MRLLAVLYGLARADFLERVRRPAYLITLGFVVYAAHGFLPANGAKYTTFRLGDYRGLYNSHWVGVVITLLAEVFIALAGFYLVKGAVERDRTTGVGQILAASRLRTAVYLGAKFVSNLAVLASMLVVLAGAAAILQWVRAEDRSVNLLAIAEPLLVLALPLLAGVAAVAVLFETVPGLRGGFGNVVYFFSWAALLSMSGLGEHVGPGYLEPTGIGAVIASAQARCLEVFPDYDPAASGVSLGINIGPAAVTLRTFAWDGMTWTAEFLVARVGFLLLAVGVAVLGTLWFDRFDTAARAPGRRRKRWWSKRGGDGEETEGPPVRGALPVPGLHVADLSAPVSGRGLPTLVRAELALMLRERSRGWWLVALGLAVAVGFVPAGVGRTLIYGFAWIWPLFMWSAMGTRERQYGTADLFFSAPRPLRRQLTATWMAGFVIAAGASAGIPLRAAVDGEPVRALAWLAGSAFIPSLALAAGVWSGGSKLFEVLYLLLWYAAVPNGVPYVDYGGFTEEGLRMGTPFAAAAVTAGLCLLAGLGRRRELAWGR